MRDYVSDFRDMLLDNLNQKQKEAVETTEGPVLILAGPGSGKTRVLTHRIAYLLSQGVPPDTILAVTFTNKAAEEMRERVRGLAARGGWPVDGLFLGTFHSQAVRILRVEAPRMGFRKNFTIFDEDDAMALLKEVLKEEGVDPKRFPPGLVMNIISRSKNELMTPARYAEESGLADPFSKTICAVWRAYQKRLQSANAMDFDDLILHAVLLLKEHPDVAARYQERFHYIHVDEHQDVNTAQHALMSLLAARHRNICIVGDPDQSIYGWRGADFRNILSFEKEWPDAKIIVLDQNYRSTPVVLEAASAVICHNSERKEKTLSAQRHGEHPITLSVAENEYDEARAVFETMECLAREGIGKSDIAILYRTNAQSRALEEVFLEEQIPYVIIGGIRFYQRREVKDIIAYVRYLLNHDDHVSLKRIINVPARGIGPRSFLLYLQKDKKIMASASLREFETVISGLRERMEREKPTAFLKTLVRTIGYREYLEGNMDNADERWENIEELVSLARRFDEQEPMEGLSQLLEDVALLSEADGAPVPREAIRMMTLHAAKGLEFPAVFIVGLEEGILPHSRAFTSRTELEEERRLFYVGLTRAQDRVFLSCALRRAHFGALTANPPSRFLGEIPEHLLEIKEDATIEL